LVRNVEFLLLIQVLGRKYEITFFVGSALTARQVIERGAPGIRNQVIITKVARTIKKSVERKIVQWPARNNDPAGMVFAREIDGREVKRGTFLKRLDITNLSS
jgi:hypothetical protein